MYEEISEERIIHKPDHPKKNANWLSLITFWYTIPLFRTGNQREFDENDVTKPLDAHKSSILGYKLAALWSNEVRRSKKHEDKPHLTKVLLRMFWKDIVTQGTILLILQLPIRLSQPLFLGLLVRYFSHENQNSTEPARDPMYLTRILHYWQKQSPVQLDEAYLFASGVFLCSLANVMTQHPCMMEVMHLGMKLRIACCSLIYRKTLRLDLTSLTGSSVGTVVNLMSNDVSRFDTMVIHMHYIWIAPCQMACCVILMYIEVGEAAVIGICTVLAFIPLQAWFGSRTAKFRMKTAYRTDERVKEMNEIIQGMQVIKMYTWEHAFAKQIRNLRKLELKVIRYAGMIRATNLSFIMFTSRLSIFTTIIAIVLLNEPITVERVFVIISFYQILRQTMTVFFPNAITQMAEANVTLTRLRRFLVMPECVTGDHSILDLNWSPPPKLNSTGEPRIVLRTVSVRIGEELCLQNVSLRIKGETLTAVIGQVGAGKSSLLNLIMGEIQASVGSVEVSGDISYASQEPWLFSGSVRQNILFGRQFDRDRYLEVVKACALMKDFQLLPFGDQTIVGEKGASLSGGQRARVNLARAVYKEADIYLLDDPLSAVDASVAKHLFDDCIGGFLLNKLVVLVTHQVQFLSDVSNVVLMDNGRILAEGSYWFLERTELHFAEFLRSQLTESSTESISSLDSNKIDVVMKDLVFKSRLSISVIDKEGERYKPRPEAEIRIQGAVDWTNYREYFKAGGNCCVICCVFALFFIAESLASGGDYFVASWIDVEERRYENTTTSGQLLGNLSTKTCVVIYSILICSTIVTALTRSIVFFCHCVRSSLNLHDQMFRSIITAPMRFFNTHTSGRVLNRFSKDLGSVDEILPIAMLDCFQNVLNLLGAVSLVISANVYFIVPTVLMCIVFYRIRSYYLNTSRSTKRLEGTTSDRSPVFGHLNATIQGVATIRSNGAEKILTSEFDRLQDDHSGAWFMFISTARAFGYWLDVICALYIGLICYSFLFFSASGSKVGLAVTTTIGLTGLFQWGMKQSAEVENQMTSVERVLEYTRIDHEPDLKSEPDKKPPPKWPTEGRIEFKNVVLRYKPNDPPVLKSLSFVINPKEKIGIVGRTGAGKSSLISALFRLAHFEGAVVIDGINTTEIGLHDLRGKISIIPQEPVLFSGTLRYNMDPFQNFDDDSILEALRVVESNLVQVEGSDYLKHHISEGGVNVSVGERQLICLARAVLRSNRILVLDEATASIDPQTDTFIQSTIRESFAECTVLTIAHRLNTIMDSDRVLVIDAGDVAEFDHPHLLLKNNSGVFFHMVHKTGKAMANNLTDIAKENYQRKRKV